MGDNNSVQLQVGVKILLRNKNNKYLLVRRNPHKYPEIGAIWDIVGGRINPGISLLENLRREVREEIGLELKEMPKLVAAQDILRVPGKHVVRLSYIGNIEGEPKLDGDHIEYKWFTANELSKLGNELDVFFKELLEKKILKL